MSAFRRNLLQITHQQPRRMLDDPEVFGVLVLADDQGNRRAFDFQNPATNANTTTIAPLAAAGRDAGSGPAGDGSLLLFMAFAALGGLILNLMPCVFPVLSIKALSFAKNAGESAQKQRLDGLAYTAGVLLTFVLLASGTDCSACRW